MHECRFIISHCDNHTKLKRENLYSGKAAGTGTPCQNVYAKLNQNKNVMHHNIDVTGNK